MHRLYYKPIIVASLICLLGSVITRDTLFGLLAMVGLTVDQIHSAINIYVSRKRIDDRTAIEELVNKTDAETSERIKNLEAKIDSLTATISMLSRRV